MEIKKQKQKFFFQQNLFLKRTVGVLKKDQDVGISTCSTVRRRLPAVTENRAVWVSLLVVFFIQTLLPLAATFPVGKTSPGPIVQIQYGFVQGLILSIANPVRSKSSWASLYETPPIGINLFSWTRNPQKLATTHMADRQKLLFLNDDSDSLIWTGLVDTMVVLQSSHLLRRDTILTFPWQIDPPAS